MFRRISRIEFASVRAGSGGRRLGVKICAKLDRAGCKFSEAWLADAYPNIAE